MDTSTGSRNAGPRRRRPIVAALFVVSALLVLPIAGAHTPPQANLLKDIDPGAEGSEPQDFTPVGDIFFFSTLNPGGFDLWKSDGTAAGTSLVKDMEAEQHTRVGDTLYFSADDPSGLKELWKSDGTPAGTVLVKDIDPGR